MSSYELLELLEFLPEDGAFKAAVRGGEYSENEQVWRYIATEMGKLRSITVAAHGGKSTEYRTFPTMTELREQTQDAEEAEERRELVFSFADRHSNTDDA